MICPKCQSEIDDNCVCCINCGALNSNNSTVQKSLDSYELLNKNSIFQEQRNNAVNNKEVVEETPTKIETLNTSIENNIKIKTTEVLDSSAIENENVTNNITEIPKINENKNDILDIIKNPIIIVNLCIMALIIILSLITRSTNSSSWTIIYPIIYFYFICFQLLLEKAELPWWGAFIPIYNVYLYSKLVFSSGILFYLNIPTVILLFLVILKIPISISFVFIYAFIIRLCAIISSILLSASMFFLGRRFGRSGIITWLIPFAVIPTIALSNKYNYE